jgi:hypothetical protein
MSEARAYGAGIWCAFEGGMRFVLAFFLLAHGVAHLVGFVSSWKLATLAELPYKTTVFSGRVDVGDARAESRHSTGNNTTRSEAA